MQTGYPLRDAEQRDLAALPEIERRAAARYLERGFPASALAQTRTPEELAEGLERGALWVAVDAEDRPVGFVLVAEIDGNLHLEEIDVDPEHGRRGIGRALLEHVCAVARQRGHEHVTLTTYADVPWNAPWYERAGFRVLARGEIAPGLLGVVEAEARRLFEPTRRVAMRRRVSWTPVLLRWAAGAWLLAFITLSQMATRYPFSVLAWTRILPGRDKTGHFLLMGGLAFLCVLALSGRSVGGRRITAPAVLLGVALLAIAEECTQWWLPVRNFSLVDLASGLSGVLVFGGAAVLWRVMRSR